MCGSTVPCTQLAVKLMFPKREPVPHKKKRTLKMRKDGINHAIREVGLLAWKAKPS